MKKYLTILFMASFIVGCGDKTQHEQEVEILRMKQAHEREMARIMSGQETKQVEYVQQYNDDYVPNQAVSTIEDNPGYSGTTVAAAALTGAVVGHLATKNQETLKASANKALDKSKEIGSKTVDKVKAVKDKTKKTINKVKQKHNKSKSKK